MVKMIDGGTVIGGNLVQLDNKNRIHVTNQKGKSKVLTHDQFKRQMVENQDKLYTGQNFEFKKETSPAKKITLILLSAGAVITGIAYRKKIFDFFNGIKKSESGAKIKEGINKAIDTVTTALKEPEKTGASAAEKTKSVIGTIGDKAGELTEKGTTKFCKGIDFVKNFFSGFSRKAK